MSKLRKTIWKIVKGEPGTDEHRHYGVEIQSRNECGLTTAIAPAFPGVVKTDSVWLYANSAVGEEVCERANADVRLISRLTVKEDGYCPCAIFLDTLHKDYDHKRLYFLPLCSEK